MLPVRPYLINYYSVYKFIMIIGIMRLYYQFAIIDNYGCLGISESVYNQGMQGKKYTNLPPKKNDIKYKLMSNTSNERFNMIRYIDIQ